jgi:hypothetical protein
MQVVVAVNGESGRTVVRARISALNASGIPLTGGDRLVLRGDGELVHDDAAGDYFRISPREGGSFFIDVLRPNDRNLTDLEIVPPPAFKLSAKSPRQRWSDPIELTWDAAAGDHATAIEWTGACTTRMLRSLRNDTGAYVINGGEVFRSDPAAPCPIVVSIIRTAPYRSMATLFATAKQTRSVEITLDP